MFLVLKWLALSFLTRSNLMDAGNTRGIRLISRSATLSMLRARSLSPHFHALPRIDRYLFQNQTAIEKEIFPRCLCDTTQLTTLLSSLRNMRTTMRNTLSFRLNTAITIHPPPPNKIDVNALKMLCFCPPAPVAQMDRVLASEAKGHRFESCRARQ